MAEQQGPRVLVVEDDALLALALAEQIEYLGYTFAGSVASGEAALAAIERTPPDLVLLDIRLQGELSGIDVAESIRARHGSDLPFIFTSGQGDPLTRQAAERTRPADYLTKPFSPEQLAKSMQRALVA